MTRGRDEALRGIDPDHVRPGAETRGHLKRGVSESATHVENPTQAFSAMSLDGDISMDGKPGR